MAQTQSQYKKLIDFDEVRWNPDSPVIIEKMRLQHDRVYGANVLQITFRNVSVENIYGLSVVISLRDDDGVQIRDDITYNYYGMEVAPNKSFGAEEDIIVEPEATRFEVTVIRAEFSDGKNFRGIAALSPMPNPQPIEVLGDLAEPFGARLLELQPKAKLLCAPEKKEQYWRCICKRIYPNHFDRCPFCRIRSEELLDIVPTLRKEQRARAAEEAKREKERLEEEERQRQEAERLRLEEEERLAEEERLRKEEEARLAEEERIRLEKEEAKRKEEREHKLRILKIVVPSLAATILAAVLLILYLPGRGGLPGSQESDEQAQSEQQEQTEQQEQSETPDEMQTPEQKQEVKPTVILGDDLTQADERTIWRLFGTSEAELGEHTTVTVNAIDGHRYLDQELGRWNVESEAVSALLILPAEAGSGLEILTYNVTYCSKEMYAEVLAQLGITDAKVIVAAPYDASGSTAMAGLKALAGAVPDIEYEVIGHMTAKGNINVRPGPSLDSGYCGTVPKGTVVSVLEQLDNGWCKIIWTGSDLGYAYTCNVGGRYYTFEPRYGEPQN